VSTDLIAEDRLIKRGETTVPSLSDPRVRFGLAYELRVWVCVFCKEPQHYVLINGECVVGCGGAWHFKNGRRADHCSKHACIKAGDEFLEGKS
jgi:hypothetical protein